MKKQQAKYIDAYMLTVKKKNLARYRKDAKEAAKSWMKHGALAYRECVGDDLSPDMGGFPLMQFPKLVKLKPDEVVLFSYVEYASKAHRNQVNKKVNKEMQAYAKDHPDHMKDMPFDLKKMAYGGFKVIVHE